MAFHLHIIDPLCPWFIGTCTRLIHTFFTATISAQRLGYLTSQHWIHDDCLLVGVVDGIFVCILESVVYRGILSGVACVLGSVVDSNWVCMLDSAVGCRLVCVLDSAVVSGVVCVLNNVVDCGLVCALESAVDSGVVCVSNNAVDCGLVCALDSAVDSGVVCVSNNAVDSGLCLGQRGLCLGTTRWIVVCSVS